MNNFDKKVIFFDIDGTLLITREHLIMPSTITILDKLSKMDDIDLYISSGRSIMAMDDIDIIKPYFTGFNAANGCSIFINGEEKYINPINKDILKTLLDHLEEHQISYVLLQPLNFYTRYFSKDIEKLFSNAIKIPYHKINSPKDICYDNIIEIWILDRKEVINELEKQFTNLTFYSWGEVGCDVVAMNASKAVGIKEIINLQGYDFNKTYAFGDSDNDVPMFNAVKYSIAMGQGNAKAKNSATYITKPLKEDGLEYGINEFVLKNINNKK